MTGLSDRIRLAKRWDWALVVHNGEERDEIEQLCFARGWSLPRITMRPAPK